MAITLATNRIFFIRLTFQKWEQIKNTQALTDSSKIHQILNVSDKQLIESPFAATVRDHTSLRNINGSRDVVNNSGSLRGFFLNDSKHIIAFENRTRTIFTLKLNMAIH